VGKFAVTDDNDDVVVVFEPDVDLLLDLLLDTEKKGAFYETRVFSKSPSFITVNQLTSWNRI
jgi:hypothetical protein